MNRVIPRNHQPPFVPRGGSGGGGDGGREFNYQSADRDALIAEIRKQTRKRHYHFELFRRYRERMVQIMSDTMKVIDWYDASLGDVCATPGEGMKHTITEFKNVILSEIGCSVCHRIIRDEDLATCLIPRCAHVIHTSPPDGYAGDPCCYSQLKANANGEPILCPICNEELPRNVHGG